MEVKKCPTVGGQAVIEGVMMRGTQSIVTAVRTPNGEIVYHCEALSTGNKRLNKVMFIRGVIMLWDSLIVGIKALNFSAVQAGKEEGEKELSSWTIGVTLCFSLAIGVALFFFLPAAIGSLAPTILMQNMIEGGVRMALFIFYVWGISFFKDIQRVFQYHGAEHKTIFAFENQCDLNPSEVQKFTTIHPRCGTSFIVTVLIISIIIFSVLDTSFIHIDSFVVMNLIKFLIRLLALPVIAAIAYEIQRFSSFHLNNPLVSLFARPGMWVQKITTREPDLEQIEVAIVALKCSLGESVENAREVD